MGREIDDRKQSFSCNVFDELQMNLCWTMMN